MSAPNIILSWESISSSHGLASRAAANILGFQDQQKHMVHTSYSGHSSVPVTGYLILSFF